MMLHSLIAMVAGWLSRYQPHVITSLLAENRVLKAHFDGRQLPLRDTARRRLATLAHPRGRQRLKESATLATSDTLIRWYKQRIAQKCDGSTQRHPLGRPHVAEELAQRVVRMAGREPEQGRSPSPWGLGEPGAAYRHADGAYPPASPREGACPATAEGGHGAGPSV